MDEVSAVTARPALGNRWHGRVVGVKSFGDEDVGADLIVDRLQREGKGPDLVGDGGKTDLGVVVGVVFGLPVQRLLLAEFLEEHHRLLISTEK